VLLHACTDATQRNATPSGAHWLRRAVVTTTMTSAPLYVRVTHHEGLRVHDKCWLNIMHERRRSGAYLSGRRLYAARTLRSTRRRRPSSVDEWACACARAPTNSSDNPSSSGRCTRLHVRFRLQAQAQLITDIWIRFDPRSSYLRVSCSGGSDEPGAENL